MKLRIPVIFATDEDNFPWPRALVGFFPQLHNFSNQHRWWSYVSGLESKEERMRKIAQMADLQQLCRED